MSWWGFGAGVSLRSDAAGRATSLRVAAAAFSVIAAVSADRATAADWFGDPPLRGSFAPPGYARWDGWQIGLQVGYGNLNIDFGNSTSSQVAFILRNSTLESEAAPSSWTTLSKSSTNGPIFGGFIGYNMQWSELVVGVDLTYKYPSVFKSSTGDAIERIVTTSDNIQHDVTISAQSSLKLVDYATLRARGGYAVGNFLPYATVGFALGRFNYGTNVTVTDLQTPPLPALPFVFGPATASVGKTNAFIGGVAAGLGVDWAITPGMFLRGEWEFVAFGPVNGARTNVNAGLVGIGARF